MADYCKQCSIDLFGKDFEELAGIITEEQISQGLWSAVVICEGCGPIQVDHVGKCVSDDCFCKDSHGHGKSSVLLSGQDYHASRSNMLTGISSNYTDEQVQIMNQQKDIQGE